LDKTHIYSEWGNNGKRKEGDNGEDNGGYMHVNVIIYSNFLNIEIAIKHNITEGIEQGLLNRE